MKLKWRLSVSYSTALSGTISDICIHLILVGANLPKDTATHHIFKDVTLQLHIPSDEHCAVFFCGMSANYIE